MTGQEILLGPGSQDSLQHLVLPCALRAPHRQQSVKVSDWSKGSCPGFQGFLPAESRTFGNNVRAFAVADVPRCYR